MPEQPWYKFPRIDAYGSPDPFGGFPKPDSNVQVPDGYPITALLAGTVTGINAPDGSMPVWGASITIKLDKPLNSLATHTAYIHLAGIAPGVTIGNKIAAGDIIGYSGGSKAAGSQKVPLGFALYAGDNYGYGAEWAQNLGNPLLNMTSVLNAAVNGTLANLPTINATSSSSAVDASSLIPGLSGIYSWFSSMQGLWDWLSNPIRIIKLITGILLIAVSIVLLVTPGDTIADKVSLLKFALL